MDLYADDSTVHSSHKQLNTLQDDLQMGSDLRIGVLKNDMRIHLKKTSVMTVGSRQALTKINSLKILLDNELIKSVENQKRLGIIIDKSLIWDKQIDAVCLNVTRRITLLKLLSKYVDQKSLNQYYNSYILPIFDYGCLVWGRC